MVACCHAVFWWRPSQDAWDTSGPTMDTDSLLLAEKGFTNLELRSHQIARTLQLFPCEAHRKGWHALRKHRKPSS